MTTQQHLWSMTAIISTLLVCNTAVHMVNAQQELTVPKVVVAQEFRLVNAQDKTLATMAVGLDGEPQIALFDGRQDVGISQQKRLEMSVDGAGHPALQFNDNAGKARLKLFMVEYMGGDPAPVLAIMDDKNQVRSAWRINSSNKSDLIFSENSGARATLQTGLLTFKVNGSSEQSQTSLFAFDGRGPGLVFADKNGRRIWTAPPKKAVKSKK